MKLEGDAIVLDAQDVQGFLREMYTEISAFLPEAKRLVIPLDGVTGLGLKVEAAKKRGKSL